jgi:hypothetical protein
LNDERQKVANTFDTDEVDSSHTQRPPQPLIHVTQTLFALGPAAQATLEYNTLGKNYIDGRPCACFKGRLEKSDLKRFFIFCPHDVPSIPKVPTLYRTHTVTRPATATATGHKKGATHTAPFMILVAIIKAFDETR